MHCASSLLSDLPIAVCTSFGPRATSSAITMAVVSGGEVPDAPSTGAGIVMSRTEVGDLALLSVDLKSDGVEAWQDPLKIVHDSVNRSSKSAIVEVPDAKRGAVGLDDGIDGESK